jgi:hypothetical protein
MTKRVSCVRTRFEAKARSNSIFSSLTAQSRASSIPSLLRGISIQPTNLSSGLKHGAPCLTSIRYPLNYAPYNYINIELVQGITI